MPHEIEREGTDTCPHLSGEGTGHWLCDNDGLYCSLKIKKPCRHYEPEPVIADLPHCTFLDADGACTEEDFAGQACPELTNGECLPVARDNAADMPNCGGE